MTKKNELATIDTTMQVVPNAEELTIIMDELKDMGTLPFGRVQIAAAGAGVFKLTEPGEDDAVVATELTAVIIANHLTNVLWKGKYGSTDDKTPDCVAFDGVEGFERDSGEVHRCETCAYNKFGSADDGQGRGKACKNTRRLYLMRPGDVMPLVLTLPSTALRTFDQYRVKLIYARRQLHGVVTKITLKNATNKDGIAYSTPVFEAVGTLPAGEAVRVKQYGDGFMNAMKRTAVYDDEGAPAPRSMPADDEDALPFD